MRTLILACCVLMAATSTAQQIPRPFQPTSGMPGKDVVWVPTFAAMVDKMLAVAKVTPADFVMDLGSGDGRNIVAAAKLGARGLGVEFNPDMVALSRRIATEAGVGNRAQFIEGDMYTADVSQATVLALFLLPANMNRLASTFLEMRPGSRIVANTFGIDGWEPDERATLDSTDECESWCDVLLWIVPAKVWGTWQTAVGNLTLTQMYQTVQGTYAVRGTSHTVTNGRLVGSRFSFIAGGLTYTGTVNGDRIDGMMTTPSGQVPWRATRLAP